MVTVLLRLTVYGEDCNLFVVLMTFVVSFVILYALTVIARKLHRNMRQ